MRVHGIEITSSVEFLCLQRMRDRQFSAADIIQVAIEAGVENSNTIPAALRFVDRLIQRERKAGRLRRIGKLWRWE